MVHFIRRHYTLGYYRGEPKKDPLDMDNSIKILKNDPTVTNDQWVKIRRGNREKKRLDYLSLSSEIICTGWINQNNRNFYYVATLNVTHIRIINEMRSNNKIKKSNQRSL